MTATFIFLLISTITYVVWHFSKLKSTKLPKRSKHPSYIHNLKILQTYDLKELQATSNNFDSYKVYDARGDELMYIPIGRMPNSPNNYLTPVVRGGNFQLYRPDENGKFYPDCYSDNMNYDTFSKTLFLNEDELVSYCHDDILPENKYAILTTAIRKTTRKLNRFEAGHYDPTTSSKYSREIKAYQELLQATVGKTNPELLL